MYDIFLSYSTQDRERLHPLFHALELQGWIVFWDHRTIDIGEHWHKKIDRAIRTSKCVVVVWSKTSIESEWVTEEANIGKQRNVLLPIKIDEVIFPVGFTMRQTGNFIDWKGDVNHSEFIRLTKTIRELVRQAEQIEEAAEHQLRLVEKAEQISEISPHRHYQEFLQQGQTKGEALPEFKAAEEKFSSLLDPIEPTKTLKLFISYSRIDREHKLMLEKHLRLIKEALKHQVKLDIWSDHLMDAGEGVNDKILPELRSADLILLLVSPDFLDPERYSRRIELPIALERHEKEGIPVIPVLVRHTVSWHETLGHLTVATHENADSLEDWSSPGKFWGSVETGIRKQVEKLGKC